MLIVLLFALFFVSCAEEGPDLSSFSLPEGCGGNCGVIYDDDSLFNVLNSDSDGCLCIKGGTYRRSLLIGDSIKLVGEGADSEPVVFSGGGGIQVVSDNVMLKDLNIVGNGTVLRVKDSSSVNILSSSFSGDGGNSVYVDSSSAVMIRDCSIEHRFNCESGGAIRIDKSDSITIDGLAMRHKGSCSDISVSLHVVDSNINIFESTFSGEGEPASAAAEFRNVKAAIRNSTFSGYTLQGIYLTEGSSLDWSGGSLKKIFTETAALYVSNGEIHLRNVDISDIDSKTSSGGLGIVATGSNSSLDLKSVKVERCRGTGVVVDDNAKALLSDFEATENGFAGLWVQKIGGTDNKNITIANSRFVGNGACSTCVVESCGLDVRNTIFSETRSLPWKGYNVGDGVVVLGSTILNSNCLINLDSVKFQNNFRAGIIFDAMADSAESMNGIQLRNIVLSGDKRRMNISRYGIVVQNGTIPESSLVNIENAFSENDKELDGILPVIEKTFEFHSDGSYF